MVQSFRGDVAQVGPLAATLTDLWTATYPGMFVVTIANRGPATAVRLSLAIAAAADAVTQYKLYDVAIAANTTYELGPYALAVGDRLRCYNTLATVTFTVNAVEER